MKKIIVCLAIVVLIATHAFAQSVPPAVEQRIRKIYAEKYLNDFSMQKTLIDDQLESYIYIQNWNPVYFFKLLIIKEVNEKGVILS